MTKHSVYFNLLLCGSLLVLCQVNLNAQDTDRKRVWQQLLTFQNQDLNELDEKKSDTAEELTNQLIPERASRALFFSPRYFWKIEDVTDKPSFVLLDSMAFIMLPGQQAHDLYFFDEDGNPLGSSHFSTGWRMITGEFKLIKRDEVNSPILYISAGGGGSFAYASSLRQYYALLRDRAVLVRLEDRDGKIIKNSYGCPNPSIGPPLPRKMPDEWARMLSSSNVIEVLQALMWLSGRHPSIEEMNIEQEEEDALRKKYPEDNKNPMPTLLEKCPLAVDDANLFAMSRAHEDILRTLKRLTKSPNVWIKQAAEMTLKSLETGR